MSRFEVIPSLDLLDGAVVRLRHGDFRDVTRYGDPTLVLQGLNVPPRARLHVVDLEGSRRGQAAESRTVEQLCRHGYRVQLGGGIRSASDARRWIDAGVDRIVLGTALESPRTVEAIVGAVGANRVLAAIDLREGVPRVQGWECAASVTAMNLLRRIESAGIREAIVTDIGRDGTLQGPSFDLYRELAKKTGIRLIASGGIASLGDLTALARIEGVSGAIVGKALLERRFSLAEASARAGLARSFAVRVIPCLDERGGRVMKGVRFRALRDAGDPVECAKRYEWQGADEIVILDISATEEERATALDTVRRVAESIFIPLTVGGGVRSVEDFRRLLQAGADRVAVNSAAVARPSLISEAAREFGTQAVVLACDAKREAERFRVYVRGGKQPTAIDAVGWCRQAADMGAGEILLTSIDSDGTSAGYDVELVRAVSSSVPIGVIASGGAGKLEHFHQAVESGGASAVLAASLFHDQVLGIGQVKGYLAGRGVPVR